MQVGLDELEARDQRAPTLADALEPDQRPRRKPGEGVDLDVFAEIVHGFLLSECPLFCSMLNEST